LRYDDYDDCDNDCDVVVDDYYNVEINVIVMIVIVMIVIVMIVIIMIVINNDLDTV